MKKLIIAVVLAAAAASAYAACRTYTIMQGGRMVMCTECCFGGHCTINCN